ncbi:hypothetical protein SAY86_023646 [Trapa natans]|uniref:non-specific serine/threonine protein kinase n=1 Tax=Trapa natans TaxID=22666 RepID=A0AAN7LUU7_TRANT|nr:hypothetical protein SAY86_023646 [Trapa natans]
MDRVSASRRYGKPPAKLDLYSTVVIHGNSDESDEGKHEDDIYATMVYKNDEDDPTLPPLLKRLPKDFGGGSSFDYDNDDSGDFGTMIIKTGGRGSSSRPASSSSPFSSRKPPIHSTDFNNSTLKKRIETFEDDDDEDGRGGFSTFVVKSSDKESVSGTVVRKSGFEDSTMGRAVASMQAVGEVGFGAKHQKRTESPSSQLGEEAGKHQPTKISSSSIPDSVTREDPTIKYELLSELGKGSYGAVYKARDRRTSELVAIKVISLCEGEEGYEEIRGEIEMLQQCNHPNVVRYLGSYQGEEYLWIVMEYCGGGSVADLMNATEKPLEEYQIAYICREAIKGLSYLHSIFKVHRDIKGGNILLTEQGEVKLGDFGVAAQLTRTMSKRNTFIGTPHWMAPEVIQENRYDGKVDVWALGVSAIEMAEGLPPRASVHPMRVLFMISIEPAPMLEDKEKWSLVFHDFVAKCLTKEPRLRPAASEMLKHKFIEKCQCGASAMLPKIDEARKIRASMEQEQLYPTGPVDGAVVGPRVHEDFGDTVPSMPQNVAVKVTNELIATDSIRKHPLEDDGGGDFGTFIVHTGDERAEASLSTQTSVTEEGESLSHIKRTSFIGEGSKQRVENKVAIGAEDSHQVTGTVKATSSIFGSTEQITEAQLQIGCGSSTLKRETLGKKGFSMQDKLWSIYAAGNTVPIPFLRATDISPIALLSDNVLGGAQKDSNSGSVTVEALQELFTSDAQAKKGRMRLNEVTLFFSIPPASLLI